MMHDVVDTLKIKPILGLDYLGLDYPHLRDRENCRKTKVAATKWQLISGLIRLHGQQQLRRYPKTIKNAFVKPPFAGLLTHPTNLSHLLLAVPNEAPFGMEAVLLNSSAVFLKWKAPELEEQHGKYPKTLLPPFINPYLLPSAS